MPCYGLDAVTEGVKIRPKNLDVCPAKDGVVSSVSASMGSEVPTGKLK